MRAAASVLILTSLLSASACAEPPPASPALPPRTIGETLLETRYIDQAVARVLQTFRNAAPDGRSVTQADIELADRIEVAQQRTMVVMQTLPADLDGDGKVTRAEAEQVVDAQFARSRRGRGEEGDAVPPAQNPRRAEMLARFMIADGDQDGVVTIEEMLVASESQGRSERAHRRKPNEMVLYLIKTDPNGDGRLDVGEAEAVTRRDFAAIDTNGDGEISNNERREYDKATRDQVVAAAGSAGEPRPPQPVSPCNWPGLPKGATVRAISVYGGASLSSTSIVGQDRETGVVRVVIEPGDTPLHLLLSATTPTIFAVEGAADRVQSVAFSGDGSQMGVAGVAAAKASTLAKGMCSVSHKDKELNFDEARRRMFLAAGAADAVAVTGYEFYQVSLPAGTAIVKPDPALPMPEGASPSIWQALTRFAPGAVAQLDAAGVVIRDGGKAEAYDVLPQEAGLLQLAREGVLEPAQDSRGRGGDAYKVLKPMRRFPAGLNGAHGVTYFQPGDFTVPDGDIGHSCLLDAATSEVILGHPQICNRGQPR